MEMTQGELLQYVYRPVSASQVMQSHVAGSEADCETAVGWVGWQSVLFFFCFFCLVHQRGMDQQEADRGSFQICTSLFDSGEPLMLPNFCLTSLTRFSWFINVRVILLRTTFLYCLHLLWSVDWEKKKQKYTF